MKSKIQIWFYKNPAFKMLCILAISVFVFFQFNIELNIYSIFISVSFLIFILYYKYYSLAYYFAVVFTGLILSQNIQNLNYELPNKILKDESAVFKGEVIEIKRINDNSVNLIASGTINMKNLPEIRSSRILLTIYNSDKLLPVLMPGNKIFGNITVQFPNKTLLPDEFNEKKYLKSMNINWKAMTNSNNISIVSNELSLNYYRDLLIGKLKQIIDENFSENTAPVAFAVLTGNKSFIQSDIKRNFSYAGTAHLLAVSGLHTGLIAAIIYFLLFSIKNKWFKFILFSIVLAAFVFFSGMQPSAVRASAMIILYLLMQNFERPVSAINIISSVVIISIIINPSLIFSVGFQMSVSAVFGIAILYYIFYDKLKLILPPDKYINNFIISSISITLSATAITAPIVAHYFGVFTFSSVFSNLISIPPFLLSVIFLITGLFFNILSGSLAALYFASSDFLLNLINHINQFFANIDYFVVDNTNALLISVVFSALVLYLFTSSSFRHFIFRLSLSVIAILIIQPDMKIENEYANGIYLRKNMVALIEEDENKISIIAIDRSPHHYPVLDYSLAQYLKSSDKQIHFGFTGNSSIKLLDFIKYDITLNSYELYIKDITYIKHKLYIDELLPQMIEIQ